jgi:hypothetical protein
VAKKARTPAPPRPVQAPKRRVEPRQRPTVSLERSRYWGIGALAAVVVAGAIVGIVVATGGSKQGPPAQGNGVSIGNMAKLPGIRLDKPPWAPESKHLIQRLNILGIAILPQEALQVHEHMHLDVYDNGKHVDVPQYIGFNAQKTGLTPLHTHDASGVIHKESASPYDFTLGQFFGIWGVRLSKTCIGGLCAKAGEPLRVFVNGHQFLGDPTRIVLRAHDEIAIAYGTLPKKVPKSYHFPAGL